VRKQEDDEDKEEQAGERSARLLPKTKAEASARRRGRGWLSYRTWATCRESLGALSIGTEVLSRPGLDVDVDDKAAMGGALARSGTTPSLGFGDLDPLDSPSLLFRGTMSR